MKPVKLDKENLLQIKSRIDKFISEFDPLMLSYAPFVGWFIPMIMKKDDEFYMFHAKQAFVLAAYVIASCSLLYYFAHIFLPSWMDILRFILVMIIYVHYILYAAACVMGTMMIKNGEKKDFPYIGKYVARFTAFMNF